MNKKEKLALLFGMLSGDGCLPIAHNGAGYRDYKIVFCNTNIKLVRLFANTFQDVFRIEGTITKQDRPNKKRLFYFTKYSKEVEQQFVAWGFPEGIKRDVLRIPQFIKEGNKKEKFAFIRGVLITDGSLRRRGDILFHSGSRLFLKELSKLISEFTGTNKPIREYVQREVYKSYQLNLNMQETKKILLNMPT